jgi:hypothetical protein
VQPEQGVLPGQKKPGDPGFNATVAAQQKPDDPNAWSWWPPNGEDVASGAAGVATGWTQDAYGAKAGDSPIKKYADDVAARQRNAKFLNRWSIKTGIGKDEAIAAIRSAEQGRFNLKAMTLPQRAMDNGLDKLPPQIGDAARRVGTVSGNSLLDVPGASKLPDAASGLPAKAGSALAKAPDAVQGIPGVSKVASALANPATADIAKDLAKNSLKGINVVSVGLTAYQVGYDIRNGKATSRALAEGGGSLVGGAVGGAIGSLIPIPVVGTAVGSLVGSYLGGKVGDWLADRAGARR